MKRHAFPALTVGLLAMLFLHVSSLTAQTVTGTILGTVSDQQGAVVPGVTISVRNLETGAVRTATTDASGAFRVASVPAGSYEVTASAPGFKTEVRSGMAVTVGADVTANLTLNVGAVEERVMVTGEAPQIDATTSTMGGLVNDVAIRELPLNGRDWLQLATLQAGTVYANGQSQADSARVQRGNGIALSVSGGRPSENVFRIDGLVVNDYANSGPGSALRVNLGVDAIREFSVLTNMYSAEYGRSTGGVINAITKSGTNGIHGSAFYFHRNSALDARNFFDGATVPPFRRHQFGGSVGGPIRKDKTFYFANFEALREFLSLSFVSDTLSPNARNGILTSGTVTVDARLKPYLPLYPLPNGGITGDTGKFIFAGGRAGSENFVTGKIDHNFAERTTLNGSYSFDDTQVTAPDGYNSKLIPQDSRRQNVQLTLQHQFTPLLINSARVGVSRTFSSYARGGVALNPLVADTSLGFFPGFTTGSFQVSGLTGFSGLGADNLKIFGYTAPQVGNDLSWVRGRHSFRTGFSFERVMSNLNSSDTPNGRWEFGSIRNLLVVSPSNFRSDLPGTDTIRGMRMSVIAGYLQDDIRLRQNLTVNLGLRYEMATGLKEVNGKMSNLRNLTDPKVAIGEPYFENPTLRNFAPRVGFAWDPFGDGKTSIRSGFGLFDLVPLPYFFTNLMPRSTPFYSGGVLPNPSPSLFPNQVLPAIGPSSLRVSYVEFRPHRAYKMQWNFSVERQLLKDLAVTLGYVGASGVHLPVRTQDINQVTPPFVTRTADGHYQFPTTGAIPKVNTNFGNIDGMTWRVHTSYQALHVSVNKRFAHGFAVQGSYTWSKSLDDGGTTFSAGDASNTADMAWAFDPRFSRGLSEYNTPQNLVVNFRWLVPAPASLTGAPRFLLAGWELGGIFQANQGFPFTAALSSDRARTGNSAATGNGPQRPDFVAAPGCTPNATNPGSRDHYIKTECFAFPALGTLGNLGRNTMMGPGLESFDFSVFKNHKVFSEKLGVQFRAEFFNLFNRANFQSSRTAVFDAQGRVLATAEQLRPPTVTTARQIQFGMKFIW